ncbi:MAG: hypothetical protein M3Q70_03345, partial [bacterium]|nr:hypothetical protein [bacterium]
MSSNDLLEKPKSDGSYEDGEPGWYGKQSKAEDGLEDSWNADNSDYDETNPTSKAKKELDGDGLTNKENAAETSDGQEAGTTAKENGFSYGGYDPVTGTEDGPTSRIERFRGTVVRKKALAGGGVIALVLGLLGIGGFLSGPFKLLQVGQFLRQTHLVRNENDTDIRTSRLIRALRQNDARQLRLGRTAQKFVNRWDQNIMDSSGLRSLYDRNTGRFVGYEVLDENKAGSILDDLDRDGIDTNGTVGSDGRMLNGSVELPDGRTSLGRVIDVSDGRFKQRRSLINAAVKGSDIKGVSGAVSSRLLQKWGGVDFHPLKNARRNKTDSLIDWYVNKKEERAQRNAEGIQDSDPNSPSTDNDGDGTPDSVDEDVPDGTAGNSADDAARDAGGRIINDVGDIDAPRSSINFSTQLKGITNVAAKAAGGVAAIVGIMCVAKSLGNAAESVQYANTILPMIRIGMLYATAADQIKNGKDVNMEELGLLASDLYDRDPEVNAGFDAAESWQAASGKDTKGFEMPAESKPSKVGDKPEIFETLDEIPFLSTACNISELFGNIPILKQVGQVSSALIDEALGAFGTSQEQLITSLVNLIAGAGVDLYAQGPQLGNIMMYGVRLASNMTSFLAGGVELTSTEEAQIRIRDYDIAVAEQRYKPLADRLFDTNDSRSLVSSLFIKSPSNLSQATAMLFNSPSMLYSSLTPRASAASIPYDYGFNLVGTSTDVMNSDIEAEPMENASIVESRMPELVEKYGGCFPRK